MHIIVRFFFRYLYHVEVIKLNKDKKKYKFFIIYVLSFNIEFSKIIFTRVIIMFATVFFFFVNILEMSIVIFKFFIKMKLIMILYANH